MTFIDEVAVYLPGDRVSVADLAEQLGLTAMQVRLFGKFFGFAEVCRDRDGTLTDLLYAAAAELKALRGREHLVRYVVHARNTPVVAPYPLNPLHEVSERLGLGHAVTFTITHHACATGLIAIDAVGWLLATDSDRDGLMPAGRPRNSSGPNTGATSTSCGSSAPSAIMASLHLRGGTNSCTTLVPASAAVIT